MSSAELKLGIILISAIPMAMSWLLYYFDYNTYKSWLSIQMSNTTMTPYDICLINYTFKKLFIAIFIGTQFLLISNVINVFFDGAYVCAIHTLSFFIQATLTVMTCSFQLTAQIISSTNNEYHKKCKRHYTLPFSVLVAFVVYVIDVSVQSGDCERAGLIFYHSFAFVVLIVKTIDYVVMYSQYSHYFATPGGANIRANTLGLATLYCLFNIFNASFLAYLYSDVSKSVGFAEMYYPIMIIFVVGGIKASFYGPVITNIFEPSLRFFGGILWYIGGKCGDCIVHSYNKCIVFCEKVKAQITPDHGETAILVRNDGNDNESSGDNDDTL